MTNHPHRSKTSAVPAHTPTPWRHTAAPNGTRRIKGGVAYLDEVAADVIPEDAAFIVRAVNAHDALLAALKAVVERSSGHLYTTDQETGETFDALARAAIARAEGVANG